ncbi:MAG: MFS transporter [Pacificimonas sp.]|jgi:predicted MFS family arabinose efflux permease|nr:MFS transporter [Pacificimonas sp.]
MTAEPPDRLSRAQLYLFAVAGGVVVANAYYIHPIVSQVAAEFGIGAGAIGAVPALNQIALAIGIFLFLPLGDRMGNAKLARVFVALQLICVAGMAIADRFELFVLASTLLGLVTIAPYLIPTYVSKRVAPEQMGHAMALLTTGVIMGILVARVGAGVIGEYYGWRAVYGSAAALMLAVTIALPLIMEGNRAANRAASAERPAMTYRALLASTLPIARAKPAVILSGIIQGLGFGVFLALWLGIGLHLPSIGYGVDVVGYLAAFTILNLFTTPYLGRVADRMGAEKARMFAALTQIPGVILLWFAGASLPILVIAIVSFNLVGPLVDVCGRMTFLSEPPEIRTRLMTVYIMLMFIGGGLGSWLGTIAYDWAGWTGTCMLALTFSLSMIALSAFSWWRSRREIVSEPV